VLAEVVGFNGDRAFLMPTGELHGLASGARVRARSTPPRPPRWAATTPGGAAKTAACTCRWATACSAAWSTPRPPAGPPGPLTDVHSEPMVRRPINAMDRDPVRTPLDTGVRAINAC
jgi:flagellum-specific ATP synthase